MKTSLLVRIDNWQHRVGGHSMVWTILWWPLCRLADFPRRRSELRYLKARKNHSITEES